MCQLCVANRAKDTSDCALPVLAPLSARVSSTAYEIPGDDTTAETIAVGGVRTDTLDTAGDEDWFRLTLSAGQSVTIQLTGTGETPLSDPYLWLYDSAGALLAHDDDGGPGLGSQIEFTASADATFLIAADSYGGLHAGDYRLSVAPVLPMTDSVPGSTATQESIALGGTVSNRLDYLGDTDWFRLALAEGQTALLEVSGTGDDGLYDPVIRVYDSGGRLVQEFDDGPSYGSSHRFNPSAGGTYFVEVASHGNETIGDYVLTATETDPPRLVNSIRGATRLDTQDPVLVYLALEGDRYENDGTTYTATGFNAYEAAQLWSVIEGVERFADIDFELTADRTAADLEWGSAALGASLLGFFMLPSSSGQGGFGLLNDGYTAWRDRPGGGLDAGGFMYGVAIHEFGHALGLAHTHDTGSATVTMNGVASNSDLGDFELNQTVFTAMSYNDGWRSNPDGRPGTYNHGYSRSFGAIDVAALQEMYGANTAAGAGNDSYTLTGANGAGSGYATIWDTGGTDEIRHDGAADAIIDLRSATLEYEDGGGGFISRVTGVFAGLTIANGTVVENAKGGGGNDLLTGNAADNVLTGGDGADTLDGGDGDDTLVGGAGDDTLTGGAGADVFRFGPGDGVDFVVDFTVGIDLIDLFHAGVSFREITISDDTDGAVVTYASASGTTASDGSRIELAGIDATTLSERDFLTLPPPGPVVGTSSADLLVGTDADDEIQGLGGNDTLDGRGGADRLDGGPGRDTATYATAGAGVTLDLARGGTGGDAAGDIFIGVENVVGSAHADRITGDDGQNRVEGGNGADELKGAGGADEVLGGGGNDRLWGNDGDDLLLGGGGQDFLWGGAGNDVLDAGPGSTGRQYMYGEAGSDIYRYDRQTGDAFITAASEGAAPGDTDRVVFAGLGIVDADFSSHDYSGTGAAAQGIALVVGWQPGTGRGDLRVAQAGRFIESFEFADGTSFRSAVIAAPAGGTRRGGDGDELMLGGAGQDFLWGGAGNDVLDAGAASAGRQYLYGERGSDTYIYARENGDVFITAASEGEAAGDTDRVVFAGAGIGEVDFTSFDYTGTGAAAQGVALIVGWQPGTGGGDLRVAQAGRFIESFEFADGTSFRSAVIAGPAGGTRKGGDGDELMLGGAGQDFLWGGAGNDVLDAGAASGGRQYLYGERGSDTYIYARENGDVFITAASEGEAAGDTDRIVFADLGVGDLGISTFDYSGTGASAQGLALVFSWQSGATRGDLRVAQEGRYIESFEFADGSVLTSEEILALV